MNSVPRLFDSFQPTNYALDLTIDRLGRSFTGTVSITGVTTRVGGLSLHAKDLRISRVTIDDAAAAFSLEDFDEIRITQDSLEAGEHVVTVEYGGKITDTMNGIYPCYYEHNGEKKELIATQFESHYAREAFPCVDEPEAKATFDVTLRTETGVTVLGNMPIARQDTVNNALVTSFETSPRMSTYLLAWVVGELQRKTATTKGGVEVAVWSTLAHPADSLDFGLDIAVRTIDFFDSYFGVPYPLPKSDHVALPDFASGAMENWGLITYRESALLVDDSTSLHDARQAATIIAHELSHQWFGNLVTMKWWNDLWLNESFANMMEYVAIDALHPEWNIWLDNAALEVPQAIQRDALDGVQPIRCNVTHPDEISTLFDPSIVYAKGGRLLRMLQAHIGDEALQKGLSHYFTTHKYGNTTAEDLWTSLSDASGLDVGSFMTAWITQPGFPVVHAEAQGDTISLQQEQFFTGEHQTSTRIWPIPLHGSNPDIPTLLEEKEATVPYSSPQKALLLNQGGSAHFIPHYKGSLSSSLYDALPTLDAVDRLHVLYNTIILAKSGTHSSAEILRTLKGYIYEREEPIWSIVAMAIQQLKKFVTPDSTEERNLKQFVRNLTDTQYTRLGWDTKPGESEDDLLLRRLLISLRLYADDADCVQRARDIYAAYSLEDIDPELRASIIATTVKNDPRQITLLVEAYTKTSHAGLRSDIAAGITALRNTTFLPELFAAMKNSAIVRPQDFNQWLVSLLRNAYTKDSTWQWTKQEWPWVVATFADDSHFDMLPRYIAGSFTTASHLEDYISFFKPYRDDIKLEKNIALGITEINSQITMIARDKDAVVELLTNTEPF